jgi:hypothetical protein
MIEGDVGVIGIFSARATVDAPLTGKQLPPEFVAETRAWLEHHRARVEAVADTVTPGRAVHELVLTIDIDGEQRRLPVMLVATLDDELIRDLRIYHSTLPITDRHELRRPIMDYRLAEPLPDAFLAERPLSATVGAITDDGEKAVYEYMVDAWGETAIPPQAGAVAYAYAAGADGSMRVYDDVEPPA